MSNVDLVTQQPNYKYNNNEKKDGVVQEFTREQLEDYAKCSADPGYFCRTHVKVIHLDRGLVPFDLYEYQDKMFDHFNSNRFNIILACRQSGKCGRSDSYIYIRNKKTNLKERINVEDFHARIKNHL